MVAVLDLEQAKALVLADPNDFEQIPSHLQTMDVCRLVIENADPSAVSVLRNIPLSDELQLKIVHRDAENGQYILNPCQSVEFYLVFQTPSLYQTIPNPTHLTQLAYVQVDGNRLEHVIDPSDAVIEAAILQNSRAIKYARNAPEDLKLLAVTMEWFNIHYCRRPSDLLQITASSLCHGDERIFDHCTQENVRIGRSLNPNGDWVIRAATLLGVQNDPEQLDILRARNRGASIQNVFNQTEAIQLAAIRQSVFSIEDIRDPTDDVLGRRYFAIET